MARLAGNVVPPQWLRAIRTTTGKPFAEAALLLAEIWGWYLPAEEREAPGAPTTYRRRFDGDMLVLTYTQVGNLFGWTKALAKQAYDRLEEMGLIVREWRSSPRFANVLHVRPVVAAVVALTYEGATADAPMRTPKPVRGGADAPHLPKKQGDHPPCFLGDGPPKKQGDSTISLYEPSERGGGGAPEAPEAAPSASRSRKASSPSSSLVKDRGEERTPPTLRTEDVQAEAARLGRERNASMALVRFIEQHLGAAYVPRGAGGAPALKLLDRLVGQPGGLLRAVQAVQAAQAAQVTSEVFQQRLVVHLPPEAAPRQGVKPPRTAAAANGAPAAAPYFVPEQLAPAPRPAGGGRPPRPIAEMMAEFLPPRPDPVRAS